MLFFFYVFVQCTYIWHNLCKFIPKYRPAAINLFEASTFDAAEILMLCSLHLGGISTRTIKSVNANINLHEMLNAALNADHIGGWKLEFRTLNTLNAY